MERPLHLLKVALLRALHRYDKALFRQHGCHLAERAVCAVGAGVGDIQN